MTFERQFSDTISLEIAASFCKKNSLSFIFNSKGERLKTFTCRLFNIHGELMSIGNGKGLGLQSKVSAIYEAIEHWCTANFYNQNLNNRLFKVLAIPEVEKLIGEKAIDILLREQGHQSIYCRQYSNISSKQVLYYPLFLSNPNYSLNPATGDNIDYTYIDCYSTNSGTATGLSIPEALIHSICELIERDALSLMLINLFIKSNPNKVTFIDKKSIPKIQQYIVSQIESVCNDEVIILEATSDFAIPTFIVSLKNSHFTLNPIGSGCSLSKCYALERALLETLQSFHLYDSDVENEDLRILKEYEKLPNYEACAIFDLNRIISENILQEKNFNTCIDHEKPSNLEEHLNVISKLINKNGHEIFYSGLQNEDSEIKCVHAVIPGLEKFNLVRTGNPILPSARGYKIIHSE